MPSTFTFQPVRLSVLVMAAMGLAACGATPGASPEDMSAAEHRAHAEAHGAESTTHAESFKPNATQPRWSGAVMQGGGSRPGDYIDDLSADWESYNPTAWHGAQAARHQKHAQDHLNAAESLESFEAEQCAAFHAKTRSICPLLGPVVAVEPIEGGARLKIQSKVNMDQLTAHAQCHVAYGHTQGQGDMAHCPLYVKGIQVKRVGQTLELISTDAVQAELIRARAAGHVSP